MRVMNKLVIWTMIVSMVVSLSGCSNSLGDQTGGGAGNKTNIKITILTQGWVNTPTDENDPFRKYLKEKYGVDVSLTATSDFSTQASVMFASDTPPDIICFPTTTDFNKAYNQGSLLKDWSPYIDQMPNFKKVMESDEITKQMFTKDGKLSAVWTLPGGIVWSLKIRKDWLEKLKLEIPKTPDDLLKVARAFTYDDPDGNGKDDTYAFTDGCAGKSMNVFAQWVPLMFGDIWYVDDNNQLTNGYMDGNHKKTLDFIRTVVSEKLIDPNWYVQTWDQKVLDYQGKVGMTWFPGTLAQFCEDNNGRNESTLDWWVTVDPPADPNGGKYAGYMPAPAQTSHILSVSSKAALDPDKMKVICQLLNDVIMTPDGNRPETYDALRWGIGVDDGPGHTFQKIPNTNSVYTCIAGPDDNHFYWETVGGGWDWGSWFSVPDTDGVIHGTKETYTGVTMVTAQMNETTAKMKQAPSMNMLTFDPNIETSLEQLANSFEYRYVTGKTDDYAGYVEDWKARGGEQLIKDGQKQLEDYGIIK